MCLIIYYLLKIEHFLLVHVIPSAEVFSQSLLCLSTVCLDPSVRLTVISMTTEDVHIPRGQNQQWI